jgi:hypothetical protein
MLSGTSTIPSYQAMRYRQWLSLQLVEGMAQYVSCVDPANLSTGQLAVQQSGSPHRGITTMSKCTMGLRRLSLLEPQPDIFKPPPLRRPLVVPRKETSGQSPEA